MKREIERIRILDAGRGLAMFAMMVHHLLYDLREFYYFDPPIINWPSFPYIHLAFVSIFILTAGITTHASRSNIKRGVVVLLIAAALTVFTLIFTPKMPIIFGILHFMGSSMIIYGLCGKYLKKIPVKIAAPLYGGLFALFYFLCYMRPNRVDIPGLFIFGFPSYSFSSADYYPIFPWIFLFLLGTLLAKPVFERRMPAWFYRFRFAPLEALGKNTLVVFILHQPIFLGILYLLFDVLHLNK